MTRTLTSPSSSLRLTSIVHGICGNPVSRRSVGSTVGGGVTGVNGCPRAFRDQKMYTYPASQGAPAPLTPSHREARWALVPLPAFVGRIGVPYGRESGGREPPGRLGRLQLLVPSLRLASDPLRRRRARGFGCGAGAQARRPYRDRSRRRRARAFGGGASAQARRRYRDRSVRFESTSGRSNRVDCGQQRRRALRRLHQNLQTKYTPPTPLPRGLPPPGSPSRVHCQCDRNLLNQKTHWF